MIFATQNQFNSFLIFVFAGIILGLISQLFFIIFLKKHQKIFLKIIFDTIFYTFFSIFWIFLLNFFNFGKFSITLCSASIVGFVWIKKLTNKTVAFFEDKWYTTLKSKFKGKRNGKKSKLGQS